MNGTTAKPVLGTLDDLSIGMKAQKKNSKNQGDDRVRDSMGFHSGYIFWKRGDRQFSPFGIQHDNSSCVLHHCFRIVLLDIGHRDQPGKG